MCDTLKRLYGAGKLTVMGLSNAVIKGWITEAQKQEIMKCEVRICLRN